MLIIKVFIRSSTLLHGTRVSEGARRLLARVGEGFRRSRGMAGVRGAYGRAGEFFGAGPPGDPESRVRPDPRCPNAVADACPGAGCPRGEPTGGPSSPPDCLARGQLRGAAFVFALLFLATYAVLGYVRHLRATRVLPQYPLFGLPLFDLPPSFAICMVLAVLAMGYATVAYLPRSWQIPVVLLLVAWFGYANNKPFKNQFENMSYSKDDLVPLRCRVANVYDKLHHKHPEHLVSDSAALDAWKAGSADGGLDLDSEGKPKLVLVAVSGGATRSAYWTAVVLDRLERTLGPSFGHRIRIISGASGGMLGAACYVTYRGVVAKGDPAKIQKAREPGPGLEPASVLPKWIREDLPMRSMEPLARGIALAEIWRAAWPGTVREDRGVILEEDWGVLRYPFADLAKLEAEGKVPSLIFSPMIVEDGRRLLISNLELGLKFGHDGAGRPSSGFDLRLMSSLKDVSGIPTEGKNLNIVAAVNNVLHFRIFDGDGEVVVDTDEKRLTEQARQIEDLRKQLESLWPPHELTRSDKDRVITAVTSIVGHTPSSPIIESATHQIMPYQPEPPVRPPGIEHRRQSLSSLEYFRLFPEEAYRGLLLSTAVRISASFPYVSPAVNLPTRPPRRVVDAGYYDNYGIQVAASWIRRNRKWLARNTSGVLLVQIRDSSSVRDRLNVDDAEPGILESASRGFQFITSPIAAAAKARYTTASFRNDAEVAALNSYDWDFGPNKPIDRASFFTTVTFENSAEVSLDPGDFWCELTKLYNKQPVKANFREVSMSWYLARAEMAATAAAIPGPPTPQPDEPDWTKPKVRSEMVWRLNDALSCLPDGPDRAIRQKRLDQLYNYERLISLEKWWNPKAR